MLTAVDVKFIFDSACLSASLEDKGLLSFVKYSLKSRCHPLSCLLAVLRRGSIPVFTVLQY